MPKRKVDDIPAAEMHAEAATLWRVALAARAPEPVIRQVRTLTDRWGPINMQCIVGWVLYELAARVREIKESKEQEVKQNVPTIYGPGGNPLN